MHVCVSAFVSGTYFSAVIEKTKDKSMNYKHNQSSKRGNDRVLLYAPQQDLVFIDILPLLGISPRV